MTAHLPARKLARLFIPLVAASLAAPLCLHAENDVHNLDQLVVSATRSPQDPKFTASSVTALSLPDLQSAQIPDLRTALSETPGVIVAGTGATGAQSSVFFRGANADQTLFVVDGVRLNTSTASYVNFLGNADLTGLGRIEVLRGPQSTLYGSSAMGGVILLETTHGCDQPVNAFSFSAGSFRTLAGEMASSGGNATTGYSVALDHTQTDNDRSYNKYKSSNYSSRIESQLAPWLLTGVTVRGVTGQYEEPGPTTYYSPGDIQSRTHLATAYAEAKAGETLRSRLTLGWYQDEYTYDDGSVWDHYYARNTRNLLDWQNTWAAASWAEFVAGLNAERSNYLSGEVSKDRSLAEYLSSTLHPSANVEVTAGLRHDRFDTWGGATTWRTGIAERLSDSTKLRATYGTGFNAPTPADRYGSAPYMLANPDVKPEKSRGWDLGVDQSLLAGRVTLAATYFENHFRDLLQYEVVNPVTYAGEMINVARARTRGAELELNAKLTSTLTLRSSYTYLEAVNQTTGSRLIRRPRHSYDGGLEYRATSAWTVGAGAHVMADRVDGAYAAAPLSGYTTFRAYTSYAVLANCTLKLRVENALDRQYQEVAGYPALPRAVYGSIDYRF